MGANLMRKVLDHWAPHLSDRGFRTLMRMAATALDAPKNGNPANLYFAGREPLVYVWRTDSRKGTEKSIYKELQRIVNELVEIGAIERTNKAFSGVNQGYRLTLNNQPRIEAGGGYAPRHRAAKGGSHTPPETGSHTPPMGGSPTPQWGGPTPPPRGKEEVGEGQEEGMEAVDLRGPVTLRAREPNEHGFIPPPQCGYPGCSRGWIVPANPAEAPFQCPTCNSNVVELRRPA